MQRALSHASSNVVSGKRGPDKVRQMLGRDASAIWHAHGGNVKDKDFPTFVHGLVEAADLGETDKGKARISADALVRDCRKYVSGHGAPPWNLWDH